MYSSLDEVEFLVRSESRVAVLDAVKGEPRTRDELKRATDASRTTLSRILADFEDRGWVERPDRRYELTPEGEFVASEITRLLENMETVETLDGTLQWLPTDEFDFDLRRLRDAERFTLRWNDPASMRRLAERLGEATRVRSIDASISREFVDFLRQLTIERSGSYEGILTPRSIAVVREHPTLRSQFREILESDGAAAYRYEGDVELAMVTLLDDQAAVCNHGPGGPKMEAILSDDVAFRSWVESYFESMLADATPLESDAFAQ